MNPIRIRFANDVRACTVDDDELREWGKAVLDDILFDAARTVSDGNAAAPVATRMTFHVSLDEGDGSLLIET